jgi:hypothetical protein
MSSFRSDGPRSFGKFEWDPTVTDSSPPDYFALLFIAIVITATTTVLAINDKYTLICCLLTEIANKNPEALEVRS